MNLGVAVDKGGVGKTTAAINIAAGLASRGKKVLAIDSDQQANMTLAFMGEIPVHTLLNSLLDPSTPLVRVRVKENLELVPATHKMFGIGIRLISDMLARGTVTREDDCRFILRRLIAPLSCEYDYILIDCPPSDNILMMNALYAADRVLIVAKPEPFCVEGVQNFLRMMQVVKEEVNPGLNLSGILINDCEVSSRGHKNAETALRQWAGDFVFSSKIRHSRPLYNAVLARQDIFTYSPRSNGALDFDNFIEELISKLQ